eukprot:8434857-Prorocentrum_lima.AAC.1
MEFRRVVLAWPRRLCHGSEHTLRARRHSMRTLHASENALQAKDRCPTMQARRWKDLLTNIHPSGHSSV